MKHHYDIEAVMERAFPQKGTLSIDKELGVITIRPLRSRRVYSMRLNDLATVVVQRSLRHEAMENRPARKRKVSRGLLTLGR